MAVQSITINLPDQLYTHLYDRAKQTKRTVEAELVDVVMTVLPATNQLPDDLVQATAHLELLDNESLLRAARSTLARTISRETERLHLKQQRQGLTEIEAQQVSTLVRQYERLMLVRACAAALLKQRGYDVSKLLKHP